MGLFSILDPIWGKLINKPVIPWYGFLTDTGEIYGDYDIRDDYSTEAKDYWVEPPTGINLLISTIIVYISVDNTPNLTDFGNATGLANGIDYYQVKGGTDQYLNEAVGKIKTNKDLVLFGADCKLISLTAPYTLCLMTFDLIRNYGHPMVLYGDSHDKLLVHVNDDLSGLFVHSISYRGMRQVLDRSKMT